MNSFDNDLSLEKEDKSIDDDHHHFRYCPNSQAGAKRAVSPFLPRPSNDLWAFVCSKANV